MSWKLVSAAVTAAHGVAAARRVAAAHWIAAVARLQQRPPLATLGNPVQPSLSDRNNLGNSAADCHDAEGDVQSAASRREEFERSRGGPSC